MLHPTYDASIKPFWKPQTSHGTFNLLLAHNRKFEQSQTANCLREAVSLSIQTQQNLILWLLNAIKGKNNYLTSMSIRTANYWKTTEIVLTVLFKIYYTTKHSGKILCNSMK